MTDSVTTRVALKGAEPSISSANALEQKLRDLNGLTANTYVYTNFRRTGSGQGQAASPNDGPRYGGGYTGPGDKYEAAGVVHRDEVVIPKELVHRDRDMLKARYGHLPGMDQLHTGGLAGYARGGRVVSALEFAGLPSLNTATMNLGALNKALAASRKALELETGRREDVISAMGSLRGTVQDGLRSQLFGGGDEWSSGGGIAGATGILLGDSAMARTRKKQIAALKKKGLDGAALDELLAQGTPAEITAAVASSVTDLRRYEAAYETRASLTTSAGSAAASAAYGADVARTNAELKELNRRVDILTRVTRSEHRDDRRAQRKGARSAGRSGHRGKVRT